MPTRRQLLTTTAATTLLAALPTRAADAPASEPSPKKILVIGAHPGDPEAACGGTIARYTAQGHAVTALYLTRGQAGITGKSHDQAAAIRTAEAQAACKILHCTPVFADQLDAATEVTTARTADFTRLISSLNPSIVFTHWPVDTHADHRAAASLTLAAWIALDRAFSLFFHEVDLGSDTQCFHPTHYVNINSAEPQKRQACMSHASQNPNHFYNQDHLPMMRFRGSESAHPLAEAFIHHPPSPPSPLP